MSILFLNTPAIHVLLLNLILIELFCKGCKNGIAYKVLLRLYIHL